MSGAGAADEWDVVVPADGEELLAELRRRGVVPGQRLHVRSGAAGLQGAPDVVEISVPHGPAGREGEDADREALPDYIGSFDSGQPDLAERSEEILSAHFPDR